MLSGLRLLSRAKPALESVETQQQPASGAFPTLFRLRYVITEQQQLWCGFQRALPKVRFEFPEPSNKAIYTLEEFDEIKNNISCWISHA